MRGPSAGSGEFYRRFPRGATSDFRLLAVTNRNLKKDIKALELTKGKVRGENGAAKLLDIHPNTLYSRMKKHGIKKQPVSFS